MMFDIGTYQKGKCWQPSVFNHWDSKNFPDRLDAGKLRSWMRCWLGSRRRTNRESVCRDCFDRELCFGFAGELDEETLKLMETPRCGVKDKVGFATDSRSKRYALQGKSEFSHFRCCLASSFPSS